MDDPGILSRREVRLLPEAAREEVLSVTPGEVRKPVVNRCPGLLGDLELDRPTCLLLNDHGTVSNPAAGTDIIDLQLHKIAAPQLSIDREIEEGEVALSMRELRPHPNCANVLRL